MKRYFSNLIKRNDMPGARECCVFAATLLVCLGCACSPETLPTLKIEPEEQSLGDVKQFTKPVARFNVTNSSPNAIVIKHIRTTCGCVAPNWCERQLEAGEAEELSIAFYAGSVWGSKTHRATLFGCVGEATAVVELGSAVIHANVLPDIQIEPDRIEFKLNRTGDHKTLPISLSAVGMDQELDVHRFETTNRAWTINKVAHRSSTQLEFDITFDSKYASADITTAEAVFWTNSEAMPTLRVALIAHIQQPVKVNPYTLFFARHSNRNANPQSLSVTLLQAARAGIDATCKHEHVIIDGPRYDGVNVSFVITIDEQCRQSFESNILINDSTGQTIVAVPIRYLSLSGSSN